MLHPSTKKLIDKLIEMTASSKISWAEGDDGACIYDTEGYRVTIGQSPSRVVLLDAGGRVLETVSESLLANTKDDSGLLYTVKVDQLVSDARRQVTGAADVMDRIVSALDLGGSSGIDADIEEVEEGASPPPAMVFPDEGEMKSRVALLAESVNNAPPVQEAEDPEDTPEALTTSPEDTGASPWSMPEPESVADLSSDATLEVAGTEPAESEPVLTTSPTFGAIGNFGGPSSSEGAVDVSELTEEAEVLEPAAVEPEPVAIVHEAFSWDSAARIDASIVVADEFVEASNEEDVVTDTPLEEADASGTQTIEAPVADNVVEFAPLAREAAVPEPVTIAEKVEEVVEEATAVAPPEPLETIAKEEATVDPEVEAKAEEAPKEDPPPARRTVYKYNPWM